MRSGTLVWSTAPLARTFIQDYGAPSLDHVAVLGFSLHTASTTAPIICRRPRGSSALLQIGARSYRSSLGFHVPVHKLVKASPFSLRRALSGSGGPSDAGISFSSPSDNSQHDAGSSRTSSSSKTDSSTVSSASERGHGSSQQIKSIRGTHVVPKAAARDAAALAPAREGVWSVDVAGYTRKGYVAGGGKEENQDRWVQAVWRQ